MSPHRKPSDLHPPVQNRVQLDKVNVSEPRRCQMCFNKSRHFLILYFSTTLFSVCFDCIRFYPDYAELREFLPWDDMTLEEKQRWKPKNGGSP